LLEDSKIIELFFARIEQAIVELSEKYGTVCNRIARNILKNDLDAEECVNDTYLAAWNTIPPQKPDPLRTYIFRIVRNIAIAKYHSNTSIKRNSYYDVALEELENCLITSATVEQEISAKELSRQIDSFLDTLDKASRVMFVRRYWYSDSISDLAEYFQVSNNNVSVRLSRTRDKLKKYLKKEGFEL
jgi:RNA polymerase sigma factor (sigma-70 family)